jgi:hypothetical protein
MCQAGLNLLGAMAFPLHFLAGTSQWMRWKLRFARCTVRLVGPTPVGLN